MNVGGWQRWTLGLAVAAVIPIAVGGGACGGKNESPEPSAGAGGMSAMSGSSPDGSAAAGASGSSAGGSASGSSAGGSSAGHAGSASGGASAGGGGAECCMQNDTSACTADGQSLKTCLFVMGTACGSSPIIYAHVWRAQACPSGCLEGGNGGAGGSGPHCR